MAFHVAVKAARHDLALDGPAHVRDLLGPLVDEQHHEVKIGVIGRDGLRHLLQEHGLARARRGHDQRPLALAERREQIHHTSRDRLLAGFETEPCLRVDRRQLVEHLDVDILVGRQALHFMDLSDPWPLLPSSRLHEGLDRHAFAQSVPLDHRGWHEGIASLTHVVGVGAPQESVPVGVHLQDALAGFERDRFTGFGDLRLEFRWPHTLPLHVDRSGTRRHRAATTTTAAAATTKPTTTTAIAAAAPAAAPAAALGLPLTTTITARRLASLPAKPTAAPRSPPLRHG